MYHLKLENTKKAANTLKGVDAFLLHVYAPSKGIDIEKSVASNKRVSECKASSHEEPFIVKAPAKQPQQQNGKLRCCRWLFSYCCILVCSRNMEMLGSWNTRTPMIP